MPTFEFEITRRVAISRTVRVKADDEEAAEAKLEDMIATNDKSLGMDGIQVIAATPWNADEDDIETQLL